MIFVISNNREWNSEAREVCSAFTIEGETEKYKDINNNNKCYMQITLLIAVHIAIIFN